MPPHTGTLRTSQTKHGQSESKAFEEIGHDVWTGAIAEALEILEIVRLRAVSIVFKKMMSDDDLWLNRLTLLALRQPSLSDLEKGAQETAYAWYQRCCTAVDDGTALALRHKQGGFPYLELYGTVDGVDGTSFTAFAELRFPMPRGFIAELIALKGRSSCRDPPYDALLCFPGAPLGCDWSFRLIFKEVTAATGRAIKYKKGIACTLLSVRVPIGTLGVAVGTNVGTNVLLRRHEFRKCIYPVLHGSA